MKTFFIVGVRLILILILTYAAHHLFIAYVHYDGQLLESHLLKKKNFPDQKKYLQSSNGLCNTGTI